MTGNEAGARVNDSPRVFVPPPLVFASLLAIGLVIDSSRFAIGSTQALGIGFAGAGLALIAAALGYFRKLRTRPEPWQPASALVTTGIYRISRNPMYLGMTLLSIGVALIFSSFAGVGLSLLAAIIIDRAVIKREEAYLVRRFGAHYQSYAGGVRRWL